MTKKPIPRGWEWDRFSLYEVCAQNPGRDVRVLRAIYEDRRRESSKPDIRWHGSDRLILGEDFCGTAALSRAWCALMARGRAVGVDIDAGTLERARKESAGMKRVELMRADVMRVRERVDLIAVLNFSVCEIHERRGLVRYLRHARGRLRRGGCFVCDVYGGADAFETGMVDERIRAPAKLADGRAHPAKKDRITYSWEQREADPMTGRVVNAMHFEVHPSRSRARRAPAPVAAKRGEPVAQSRKPQVFLNAFVYDWRLWSVTELRDAMVEAGFSRTQVYPRIADAKDGEGNLYVRPVEEPGEVGESFNVFVVGRR